MEKNGFEKSEENVYKDLVTDMMYFYKNTIIIKMTIVVVVVIPLLDIYNVK